MGGLLLSVGATVSVVGMPLLLMMDMFSIASTASRVMSPVLVVLAIALALGVLVDAIGQPIFDLVRLVMWATLEARETCLRLLAALFVSIKGDGGERVLLVHRLDFSLYSPWWLLLWPLFAYLSSFGLFLVALLSFFSSWFLREDFLASIAAAAGLSTCRVLLIRS